MNAIVLPSLLSGHITCNSAGLLPSGPSRRVRGLDGGMTLDDLGNPGDLVGGLLVVTLVYLALQVRHDTRAVITSAYLQLTESIHDAWQPLVDVGTADVYARGLVSYRGLTLPEQLASCTILSGVVAAPTKPCCPGSAAAQSRGEAGDARCG